MSVLTPDQLTPTAAQPAPEERSLTRLSAGFGVAFTVCQLSVMLLMAFLVLPNGGSPSDPALTRGQGVFDAETTYRVGNFVFMLAGGLLLGFLGVVRARLRTVDSSGVLATVALASGTLLALIWPLGGMLHDVALETARAGTDLRILAGWDAVAPYTLALSVLPRVFFVAAIALGLKRAGTGPWLVRMGLVILPLSLVGSAVTIVGELFPVLALSTLMYEVWVGAVAWHWLRARD